MAFGMQGPCRGVDGENGHVGNLWNSMVPHGIDETDGWESQMGRDSGKSGKMRGEDE